MNSGAIGNLLDRLQSLLSPGCIHSATSADVVAGMQPQFVCEPATEQELTSVLRFANEANLAVIPRGGGTKLEWGNPPVHADLILSTKRLNKIIEHAWADLTVTVEAGCTFHDLQLALAQHGQRLALDPLWPKHATIGGVLSTNDSGALRLRFGALRDLIIGVTIALPDGTLASSGGKVVKNVAGYDLPKLITGALGTLGVITRAVFRVHPVPQTSRTFSCIARDVAELQRFFSMIQNSKLAYSALQGRFIENDLPQLDILLEATEAGLTAQASQLKSLVAPAIMTESDSVLWKARQELFSLPKRSGASSAVAKISVLPAQIAKAAEAISSLAAAQQLRCNTVFQATGIGCAYFEGSPSAILSALQLIRSDIEREGGSLVILHRPVEMPSLDAWGTPGDALPLMRAVKQQFDPKNTLNPGRFVGGI